ncbi:T9SS type A sorting domain-containing protein [Chryseobacterium indologenes]|nr:T9SS type A sorting domain-containing protein [Chryseobacterium indologenes]
MKKIYPITICLFSVLSFAQQRTSFEDFEGFYTGSIHAQGTWISTPTGDEPPNILNQMICIDDATDGYNSLRIVKENTYGTQPVPVIGAFNNTQIQPSTGFSVSFDINMSQLNGSVFGFQGVNNAEEKFVIRVDFGNTGSVKILDQLSGPEPVPASGSWQPNTWHKFLITGTASEVKYYLDNVLIYTGAIESINIDQVRFVHNNADGSAYIDNIQISNENLLSTKEITGAKKRITIYPNPTTDFIRLTESHLIKAVKLYNMEGKELQIRPDKDMIDVRSLPAGLYIIKIVTDEMNYTEKFTKK